MDKDFNGEEFPRIEQQRTTELTLGPMVLLVIFIGLVLLCGLCFGVGYTMGSRDSQKSASAEQKPIAGTNPQAAGSLPKPSADRQKTPEIQSIVDNLPIVDTYSENPGKGSQNSGHASAAGADSTEPLVKPAQPDAASALMIQVAIVSHQEDADILIGALSKRGYTATARHDPADNKLHVQIGPFSNRNDANAMSKKLLHDGYNAIVQP
jgi:cell division septation protein DedD